MESSLCAFTLHFPRHYTVMTICLHRRISCLIAVSCRCDVLAIEVQALRLQVPTYKIKHSAHRITPFRNSRPVPRILSAVLSAGDRYTTRRTIRNSNGRPLETIVKLRRPLRCSTRLETCEYLSSTVEQAEEQGRLWKEREATLLEDRRIRAAELLALRSRQAGQVVSRVTRMIMIHVFAA